MMDRLDIPAAVIVGHSMGSFVAQALVERAAAARLQAGAAGLGASAVNDVVAELATAVESLTDPVDAEFVRDFQYSTIAQPVPEAFMDAAIAQQPAHAGRASGKRLLAGLMEYRASVAALERAHAGPRRHPRRGVLGRRANRAGAPISRSRNCG